MFHPSVASAERILSCPLVACVQPPAAASPSLHFCSDYSVSLGSTVRLPSEGDPGAPRDAIVTSSND